MEEYTTKIIALSDYRRSEPHEDNEQTTDEGEQPVLAGPRDLEASPLRPPAQQQQEEDTAVEFFIREEALFRQNVQLDLAHEHIILYRSSLVILWITALVILRQWALALI